MNTKLLKTKNNHTQGSYIKWLAILLMFLPMFAQAQFEYTTNSGTITIKRYIGFDTDIVVPDTINGLKVTRIGPYAFSYYYASTLANVTLPSTIIQIQDHAFYSAYLGSINIPNGVTSIGAYAFYQSSLTNVAIPNSVTNIGDFAFSESWDLSCVTVGADLERIGNNAFFGCRGLEQFIVDALNPNLSSQEGVLFDKTQSTLLQYPAGKKGSYVVPDNVNFIGSNAFAFAIVTNVTIPNSVTNIGSYSFGYSKVNSIVLPNSLTILGNEVFYSCGKLGTVVVPSTLSVIPEEAFYRCVSLTNVFLPNTITNIGSYAFEYCGQLTNFIFPNSLISIGSRAFSSCTSLTSIRIPDNVIEIGYGGFESCIRVTNIYIGAGLAGLGCTPFLGCSSLLAITVSDSNPNFCSSDGIWFRKPQTILYQYPPARAGVYEIPNTVTLIEHFAFAYSSNLTSLTIPNSVTRINDGAFLLCNGITSIHIPASVTNIEDGALASPSLANITVDPLNQVYSSWNGVLYDVNQTTLILCPQGMPGIYSIPDTVRTIGRSSFSRCFSLTGVKIPDSVTNMPESFYCCCSITNVTIPSSVKTFSDDAFYGCTNLAGVFFEGEPPSIDSGYTFAGWSKAIAYYLPGTTNWSNYYGGRPAVLWNPTIQTGDSAFGPGPNGFGFTVTGTADIPIVIEACSALGSAATPLLSLTLTNGQFSFSDPDWKNNPTRFYRIRSP